MKIIWQHPGIKAEAIANGIHGTGRLILKDELVYETHGGEQGIPDEWDNENQAIIDLAVLLSFEIYNRGLKEFHEYICAGFNTGEREEDPICQNEASEISVNYEPDGQGLLF